MTNNFKKLRKIIWLNCLHVIRGAFCYKSINIINIAKKNTAKYNVVKWKIIEIIKAKIVITTQQQTPGNNRFI